MRPKLIPVESIPRRPCDECGDHFDEDTLERCNAFGVEMVCSDCAEVLTDAAIYDEHVDEYGPRCGCATCMRHRERVERERNRALARAASSGAGEDQSEDIRF